MLGGFGALLVPKASSFGEYLGGYLITQQMPFITGIDRGETSNTQGVVGIPKQQTEDFRVGISR
jgi:hypothetical protein